MRDAVVTQWLTGTDWAGWTVTSMTGDASARGYMRLTLPGAVPVILMDAPPEPCGSQANFVTIAQHLRQLGLSAPEIYAWDDDLGLMVMEDLGAIDFAQHLAMNPQDERRLYEAAVDVLIEIHGTAPPVGLTIMTPDIGTDMIDLAFEWAAIDQSTDLADAIKSEIHTLLGLVSPIPFTLSLRDFHAENLIWRPDQTGLARVGLLDFQDAFVTHPMYDLASLLRDARRDVDPSLVAPLMQQFGRGRDFKLAFHVMAVQRNLRILGIFERLAQRDGKTGYRGFAQRVRDHLRADLAAAELSEIAPLIERAFGVNGAQS